MNINSTHKDNQTNHKKTQDHIETDSSRLYDQLMEGLNDITLGNTRPFAEAMADVKVKRAK